MKVIKTVEEYVKIYKSRVKPSDFQISENLFGRVLKGNTPQKRVSLTEYVQDRSCFCFAGDGMAEIISMSHDEIVDHLGFTQRYIQEKLTRNFIFELLICESTEDFKPVLADWKGVEFMIKNYFPNYFHQFWDIHEKELISKTYEEIEKTAPYTFFEVRSSGFTNEGYLTEERFRNLDENNVTLWQWRLFLYLNLGLRELFGGNGFCINTKTGLATSKEFFLPNILRKDLPKNHLFLPLQLTKKEK